jgi:hypothetical protein
MRHKSHRFQYKNLTSGNFSIHKTLFIEVGGFNVNFMCQEDYELGVRLIQKGADFQFTEEAMGYHHDTTTIKKSEQRRSQEAQASVLFLKCYPQLLPTLPHLQQFQSGRRQKNGFLLTLTYKFHFAAAVYEQYLCICLKLAERLRQRQSWLKFYKKLLDFSFLKGLAVATGSVEELQKLILASKESSGNPKPPVVLDLKKGVAWAEQKLDETRPEHVDLYFGSTLIGTLAYRFGFEPYKGVHLRAILAKEFGREILRALAFNSLGNSQTANLESSFTVREKE